MAVVEVVEEVEVAAVVVSHEVLRVLMKCAG